MSARSILALALASLAIAPLAAPGPVRAQETVPSDTLAIPDSVAAVPPLLADPFSDRIMAVVGGTLLLESEWREQTIILAGQLGVPPGSPAFRELATQTFDQMVQELVILAAAERDTMIQVDSQEVLERTEAELATIRSQFPSEEEFQRQVRQSQWGSLAAYREDLMERERRALLTERYLDMHRQEIRPVPVTDADIQSYWEENRELFAEREQTYRFEEIPVTTEPTPAARDSARAEAEAVLAQIESGADFAQLARQYSDDPGSRESGGDLGWFGRGRMVPAFEAVVFDTLASGTLGPVETPFGFHLIQILDRREGEVRARHILVGFERTDEGRARARDGAEALRERILSGADVDSLQAIYLPGDSESAGVIELPASRIPPAYAEALVDLESGEAAVIETATGFSVIVGRGRGGGGAVELEDAAPEIRRRLASQRAQEIFVERLREAVYVDIRITPQSVLTAT